MEQKKIQDRDMQYIIGNLLRYGVWTALSVAAVGGIVYLLRHETERIHYQTFIEHDVNIFQLVANTVKGLVKAEGKAIILLGILLLFLTPILRICFSLIAFFFEKDYLYVGITLLVIAIICCSIFFGFGH